MKKNDIIELNITDMGVNGEGVGRYDDMAFFVKDALPGDKVRAVVTKVKKGYAFAKMLQIIEPSSDRIIPPCPVAGRCGGCQIMQLAYAEQLRLKEAKVRNNLERIGGISDLNLQPIIGMEEETPLGFRNKVQFPVGRNKEGHVVTGFYAGRTHYIIETDSCPVSAKGTDVLLAAIRKFLEENSISTYDEETGKGLVRHVLIRKGFATGQIMVCLVLNGRSFGNGLDDSFVRTLLGVHLNDGCIASICLNINTERTNVILGNEVITLYGNPYIEDRIGELTFRISPLAFFQVNSIQTQKLYAKALEYADLSGNEVVWDLYCGTGTISLFLAQRAARVYGVEIIQAAIDNANENALLNGITNAEFYCGKSEEIFPEFYGKASDEHTCKEGRQINAPKPDVVVLDPPRKGCDMALLESIMAVEPDRIVYVSCNSATLARDIKILSEKYKLVEATPVDMFPHTVHVEVVSLLQRVSNTRERTITLDVEMEDYHRIISGNNHQ